MLPELAADEQTEVITLYEDIKVGLDSSRPCEMPLDKPVLALKAGQTPSGQAATASHTGALAGARAAFRAVCRQTGDLLRGTIREMFDGAMALEYQPPLRGGSLSSPMPADRQRLRPTPWSLSGLRRRRVSATQAALRGFLLPDAQVAGPVDMLGGAHEDDYRQALAAVWDYEAAHGVLVILVRRQ